MSKEKQTPPLVKIGIPKLSPYEISLLKELIPRASIKEIDGTIKIFIENFIGDNEWEIIDKFCGYHTIESIRDLLVIKIPPIPKPKPTIDNQFQELENFINSQELDGRCKAIAITNLQTAKLWAINGKKSK